MKNKKAHIIVLVGSICLILCIIAIAIYGFIAEKEELSFANVLKDHNSFMVWNSICSSILII